ncbi:TetR family transcriptional regulator [Ruegeria sp. HKCCD4884]|uniref:TetR/AcrR family transcriptional regulator n=1 Tax=Ruegeria sp. HKCCD4884 TaxID=2683022 RepID=UPI001491488F|nr:TetR/AcrR family transcriptional regulator [Ruegeria sp. HKCCD4884]NOD95274.1 TetR family transcriptional regulator [Ruegeria sp. HKCCD4884]
MLKIELETRYNRNAWLATAIEVLSKEGQAKLRTEHIAKALGVTRGSFYHHFKNRDEFVFALVDFWAQTFTEQTNANVDGQELSADRRLLYLMRLIRDNRLDKYDIAFRSWAAQEPAVAEKVREVDRLRYEFVAELFAEMGFAGDDLEERVRLFLVYESAQHTLWFPKKSRQARDSVERRFELITGRKPPAD